MYETVLIATDGSQGSLRATKLGLDVAEKAGATVQTLYVVDERERLDVEDVLADEGVLEALDTAPDEEDSEEAALTTEPAGLEATSEIVDAATERDIHATAEVREGIPSQEIRAYASEVGADLVVVGTHGASRASQPLVGSTAERVIATADVPVLVARAGETEVDLASADPDRFETILVPTDGSGGAGRAATHALALGDQYGATVNALYVIDDSIHALEDAPRSIVGVLRQGGRRATEEVAALADEEGYDVTVRTNVERGIPRAVIQSFGDGSEADLVVLGTRGLTGGNDPIIGSTTRRIIRETDRPVLTVR